MSRPLRRTTTTTLPSLGLKQKIFFDQETFGADRLVASPYSRWRFRDFPDPKDLESFCRAGSAVAKGRGGCEAPVHARRRPLSRPHLRREEGETCAHQLCGLSHECRQGRPAGRRLAAAYPQPLYGLGIDAVSAQDAWGLGLPGFDGLKLSPGPGPGMGRDAIHNDEAEATSSTSPMETRPSRGCWCAVISRMRFQAILRRTSSPPRSATTNSISPATPTRIRLNSTVVQVNHLGDLATATEVEISYSQQGKLYTVKAAHCILACWHTMIPYLSRTARAGRSAAVGREGADCLHQCRASATGRAS